MYPHVVDFNVVKRALCTDVSLSGTIYSSHCLITKKSVNTFKHRMEYKGLDPNYTTV